MSHMRLRSLLYIPGHVEKFVEKAARTDADVVILDLEDAVPPPQKDKARQLLAPSASTLQDAGKAVAVRINNDNALIDDDLEAATNADIDFLILPKVEDPSFVRQVARYAEAEGCNDFETDWIDRDSDRPPQCTGHCRSSYTPDCP